MSDNALIAIVLILAFLWYRITQAVTSCVPASIGCGTPSSVINGMKITTPGPCTSNPVRSTPPPMMIAPMMTMLPMPVMTAAPIVPQSHPNPPKPTSAPALCEYNQLECGSSKGISGIISLTSPTGPLGAFINNITECFCKVNTLYGKALQQGITAGKITVCRTNYPQSGLPSCTKLSIPACKLSGARGAALRSACFQ